MKKLFLLFALAAFVGTTTVKAEVTSSDECYVVCVDCDKCGKAECEGKCEKGKKGKCSKKGDAKACCKKGKGGTASAGKTCSKGTAKACCKKKAKAKAETSEK
ncbi:MAG: hypothetical protein COA57_13545 [Flavobacteriales bacterium]|nr:MAG: hypothetical protein COA57_13545 [Flavobacteriales bacterium]